MQGDVLGRGIEGLERFNLVEMNVVQRLDEHIEQALELVKIHHHADRIELLGPHRHADLPVVPVQRLEGPIVEPKLMGGGEVARGSDLKGHRSE